MSNIATLDYQRAGKIFCASNNAATIVTVAHTVLTGLIIYNPYGSGKKLIMLDAGFGWTTVPPAAHVIGVALSPASITAPSTLTATTVTGGVQCADGSGLSAK